MNKSLDLDEAGPSIFVELAALGTGDGKTSLGALVPSLRRRLGEPPDGANAAAVRHG